MPLLRPPRHGPSRQVWFRAQVPTFDDAAIALVVVTGFGVAEHQGVALPRLVPGGNLTLEI